MKIQKKKNIFFINIVFVLFCCTILIFLLKAPEETTAKLPQDDTHLRFYSISNKKEAEKFCGDCHSESKEAPLPESHPPKYRCLFCHKKHK